VKVIVHQSRYDTEALVHIHPHDQDVLLGQDSLFSRGSLRGSPEVTGPAVAMIDTGNSALLVPDSVYSSFK